MKEKYKDKNYLIIYAGKNSHENSIILCLNCNNKITCNTGELFRKRRKTLCRKCEYIRKDTIKNREFIIEKIKNEASNIYFLWISFRIMEIMAILLNLLAIVVVELIK